jgi:hypothetical protein
MVLKIGSLDARGAGPAPVFSAPMLGSLMTERRIAVMTIGIAALGQGIMRGRSLGEHDDERLRNHTPVNPISLRSVFLLRQCPQRKQSSLWPLIAFRQPHKAVGIVLCKNRQFYRLSQIPEVPFPSPWKLHFRSCCDAHSTSGLGQKATCARVNSASALTLNVLQN